MGKRTLLIAAVALSLAATALSAPTTATADDHGPLSFGAYSKPLNGQSPRQAVEAMEAKIGRQLDTVREYLVWNEDFPTSYHTWLADTGRVPIISLKPKLMNGTKIHWSTIAEATVGSAVHNEIVAWAHAFRDYSVPFYFTFHHEPEAGENDAYGTSTEYIAAWRRVVDIFRAEGVDNAEFAFTTTAWNYHVNPNDRRYVPKWYPGDGYVDLIAADAYNWGNCLNPNNGTWRSLETVIEPFRQWGATHPDKPLILAEWGTVEAETNPSAKADWFADAQDLFKGAAYDQFVGVVYFNSPWVGDCTWQVDTTPQSLAAFVAMGADPFYSSAGTPDVTGIAVSVEPTPASVAAPESDVVFAVTIGNESPTSNAWIDVLASTAFGDLDGAGTCSLPRTIPPLGSYTCSFTDRVAGSPGETHVSRIDASGWSNGTRVSASSDINVSIVPGAPSGVLLVVGNATTLSGGEAAVRDRLESLGYSVEAKSAAALATTDAAGREAILVSSTVRVPDVGTKLLNVAEPVVVWKPWLYDDMGMTAIHGSSRKVTTISVATPAHPLAAGFDGAVTILSATNKVAVGTPDPTATVIATAANQPALFAYAPGDVLANGNPAPGCRIGYPAFHTSPVDYTAAGWTIFDNTITWATGSHCTANADSHQALFIVPDGNSLNAGDDAVRTRLDLLGFHVVARSAATATAAEAAGKDLVLISSNVGERVLGTTLTAVPESVIIWKPWLYDAMGLTHTNGSNRTTSSIDIATGDHPLADTFVGPTTIVTTASKVAVGTTPAAGATVIATADGRPTLFAILPGDLLANGQPAPGCRIAYPAYHTTPVNYTPIGWALFDDIVAWAAGGCADPA